MHEFSKIRSLLQIYSERLTLSPSETLKIEPNKGIYFIENGFVRMGNDGHSIGILGPNDILGIGHWENGNEHNFTALGQVVLFHLPQIHFKEFLKFRPEFAELILSYLLKMNREKDHQICIMQKRSARERISSILISLSNTFKNENLRSELIIPVDKKTLADLSGTVIETLSRNLTDLEEENVIKRDRKNLVILNLEKLQHYSNS